MGIQKDAGTIRRMFADISPRYDLLNHILSLNVDRAWRRRTVRELRLEPGARVLDICTGTGDLALEIAARAGPGEAPRVIGSDFTPEMVRIGEAKRRRRGLDHLEFVVADSLALPFEDSTFDAVTVAFGIRNVCDLDRGLSEMLRVLRPGGQAAILEFAEPSGGALSPLIGLYFRHVLPRLGRWISRSRSGREAYSYLPRSVGEFPEPGGLSLRLASLGFSSARHVRLAFGMAALHLALKPAGSRQAVCGGAR